MSEAKERKQNKFARKADEAITQRAKRKQGARVHPARKEEGERDGDGDGERERERESEVLYM